MRWPGGLKLWRVSGPGVDLGAKQPYDPAAAADRARGHADHFAHLLAGHRGRPRRRTAKAWSSRRSTPSSSATGGSRGPTFLGDVYRALAQPAGESGRRPAPASARSIRLEPPSGFPGAPGAPTAISACGSASQTAWTWERLWPLEQSFWDVAPARARVDRGAAGSGPGGARAAAGPVVRLAVHHLDRRGGRLRRAAIPRALRETEELVAALAPGSDDVSSRAAQRRRRSWDSATICSPMSCRRSPRRSAGRAHWSSADAWPPIRFVFGLHLHQPVGNFDHVFEQHVDDVYRPLLERLSDAGVPAGRAARLRAAARVAREP